MQKPCDNLRQVRQQNTLCNDSDDTCVTVLKTFEMSATSVYMVRSAHLHKDNTLKPPKLAFVNRATLTCKKTTLNM